MNFMPGRRDGVRQCAPRPMKDVPRKMDGKMTLRYLTAIRYLPMRYVVPLLAPLFLTTLLSAGEIGRGEDVEPNPIEDRFFATILNETDRLEYEAYPDDGKLDWRRRYWARHDPTPTTPENQAEVQHMQRIRKAIVKFRDNKGRFVWDERARCWIRFGEPERVETQPGGVELHEGVIPPRELWIYNDMIVWFLDYHLRGFYEVALDPGRTYSNIGSYDGNLREDTGMMEDTDLFFEESFERFLQVNDYELDPTRARQMTETGLHRWVDLPQINTFDYSDGEAFDFLFDVASLAGADGRTELMVGFLIPLHKFEFHPVEGIERATIQRRLALFDGDYEMVDTSVANILHDRDPVDGETGWFVTTDSISVEPGPYEMALPIVATRSQNHGLLKTSVAARDFRGDELLISDIVFATAVTRDRRGEGAFLRGDFSIVPRPLRIYTPGEDVNLYFEIYHLWNSENGKGLYEVKYTLYGTKAKRFVSFFGGSSDGRLEPGIAQTFRAEARGAKASRHISLDTSDLPDDRYTLIVEVTDLGNKKIDQVKGQFVVKR